MDLPVVRSGSLLSRSIKKWDKWQCKIWWGAAKSEGTGSFLVFSSAELQLPTATEWNLIGWIIECFTPGMLIGLHRQAALNVKPWWSLWSDSCSLDAFHLMGFIWNSEKPGTTCNHVSSCLSEDYEYQRWHHGRGAEFALVMILSDFSKLRLHYRSPRRRSASRSRSRYEQIFIFVGNILRKPLLCGI